MVLDNDDTCTFPNTSLTVFFFFSLRKNSHGLANSLVFLRHEDLSSVGARLAAKDSLGLQSGLRGWQRLPVNSLQVAIIWSRFLSSFKVLQHLNGHFAGTVNLETFLMICCCVHCRWDLFCF